MSRQIIGKEKAVEALASLCRDYRGTALRAVRQGGEEVFIPANPSDPKGMLEALANPEGMMQFQSQGNDAHKEPCYASLNEYLAGRNADGTEHRGYLLVDVVAKVVTDLKDRTGRSVVPRMKPLNPQSVVNELMGRPNSYCL
jgi:hypothetical protein